MAQDRLQSLEQRSKQLNTAGTVQYEKRLFDRIMKSETNRLIMERKQRNLERRRRVDRLQHEELARRVEDKKKRQISLDESRNALLRERQLNEKALRTQRDALITNFNRMATSTKFKSLAQTSDASKKEQTFKQLSRSLARSVRPSTVSTINSASPNALRMSQSTGSIGLRNGRPGTSAAETSGIGGGGDTSFGGDGLGGGENGFDSQNSNGLDENGEPLPPPTAQQMLLRALQPKQQRRSVSPSPLPPAPKLDDFLL